MAAGSRVGSAAGVPLESPPDTRDLVRQDVLLEPTGNRSCSVCFRPMRLPKRRTSLRLGARTRRLHRVGFSHRDLRDEFRYSVATTAFHVRRPVPGDSGAQPLQTAQDARSWNA